MNWMRKTSQSKRVRIGFGLMALIVLAVGGGGVWALSGQNDSAAWALG